MNKICYVINFYFGKRRKSIDLYNNFDRLCFLKKHIELLSSVKHNLSSIIFNFNVDPEHYSYINEALKIIPNQLQNSVVEINIRENKGMSYGAWSDVFVASKNKYDYFLFIEDDNFYVEDNFDSTLLRKFNSYPNCGCLCPLVRPSEKWNGFKSHSGHHSIFSTNKILLEIYNKYGELPYAKSSDYQEIEFDSQIEQSYVFLKEGYNLYDFRDEYMVQMESPKDHPEEILRYFDWNSKEIIQPSRIVFNSGIYYFWAALDDGYSVDYLTKLYEKENTLHHKGD